MSRKKQETTQDKFWKKVGSFLEKMIFNKKIFYSILSGIVIALIFVVSLLFVTKTSRKKLKNFMPKLLSIVRFKLKLWIS